MAQHERKMSWSRASGGDSVLRHREGWGNRRHSRLGRKTEGRGRERQYARVIGIDEEGNRGREMRARP